MSLAVREPTAARDAASPRLPQRLKLLCVTTLHQSAGWISGALMAEGVQHATVEEAIGATSALSRMRDEVFDAVIVMHEPGVLDGEELIEGLRAGGHDEPIVAIGRLEDAESRTAFYEAGADAYCPLRHTTPRTLLWELCAAIQRQKLERENRRLHEAEKQRLAVEHHEAERLLAEQRGLLVELDDLRRRQDCLLGEGSVAPETTPGFRPHRTSDLPEALVANYRDVLRAYVVMGVGNLTEEMSKLAELLAASSVSASRAVQLHLDVLEQLVQGLGSRSARHVMNRADLLVLELMIHLADGYRRRYRDVEHPPAQMMLPGFGWE